MDKNDRIRTTISIEPHVHEIFKEMAAAAGTSVSRIMGEWLSDTAEGAQFITQKMKQARQTPMLAMRELQAGALGINDEVASMMASMRAGGFGVGYPQGATPVSPVPPLKAPSSNTGLKSPPPPSKSKSKSPKKGK